MKIRLKKFLALLLALTLTLSLALVTALAEDGEGEGSDTNLSEKFTAEINNITLKGNVVIYPDEGGQYEEFNERSETVPISLQFSLSEVNGGPSSVSAGDYVDVVLFASDKVDAVEFVNTPINLHPDGDPTQDAYATATVSCVKNGDKYEYVCRITFTDAAANMDNFEGDVSLSGSVKIHNVGDKVTLTKDDAIIAVITRIESSQNFYSKETATVAKEYR